MASGRPYSWLLVRLHGAKVPVAAEAFSHIINRFNSQMCRSLTYDQGTGMARHKTRTANLPA